MADYKIWKIEGFNPQMELKDGDLVFYIKHRHSPNIKLSVGKFVESKGNVENGDYVGWHVVDVFDGKTRFPYWSELIPIDDFKAADIRPTWAVVG